jgi:CRP/FNR family transcriptional regulator, cyclic AMP receptor protein
MGGADVQPLGQLLTGHPFFASLDEATVSTLEGCARNVHFRPGEYLFREGDAADQFFVIRRGRVALDVHAPGRGGVVLDTVEEGDVVGWSWLVPPYRWFLDARAVKDVSAMTFDATCLRGKCDEDPALGYALMQRVVQVMYQRLQAARVRLLDLYGTTSAG